MANTFLHSPYSDGMVLSADGVLPPRIGGMIRAVSPTREFAILACALPLTGCDASGVWQLGLLVFLRLSFLWHHRCTRIELALFAAGPASGCAGTR